MSKRIELPGGQYITLTEHGYDGHPILQLWKGREPFDWDAESFTMLSEVLKPHSCIVHRPEHIESIKENYLSTARNLTANAMENAERIAVNILNAPILKTTDPNRYFLAECFVQIWTKYKHQRKTVGE